MRVRVVVPPLPFVTVADVKGAVREDWGDDDGYIAALIGAATRHMDGPDGWLGRALGVQTLRLTLSGFCCDWPLRLPYPPIIDIVAIRYFDADDVEQTVTGDAYLFAEDRLWLASGARWPAVNCSRPMPVSIEYRAGFSKLDGTDLVNDVPDPIRIAIIMHVAHLYRNREAASDASLTSVPLGYDALLSTFRRITV